MTTAQREVLGGLGRALRANLVWAAANVLVILAVLGPAPSAAAAGAVVGSVLLTAAIGAVVTWATARTRPSPWPFWQLAALALPSFLSLRLILAAMP